MQVAFDSYRPEYDFRRPQEAPGYEVLASRYALSPRAYSSVIDYDPDFQVRRVKDNSRIKLQGRYFLVSKAFAGDPLGLLQAGEAIWDVYYWHQRTEIR